MLKRLKGSKLSKLLREAYNNEVGCRRNSRPVLLVRNGEIPTVT